MSQFLFVDTSFYFRVQPSTQTTYLRVQSSTQTICLRVHPNTQTTCLQVQSSTQITILCVRNYNMLWHFMIYLVDMLNHIGVVMVRRDLLACSRSWVRTPVMSNHEISVCCFFFSIFTVIYVLLGPENNVSSDITNISYWKLQGQIFLSPPPHFSYKENVFNKNWRQIFKKKPKQKNMPPPLKS